ncbi:MAG: universal stress protein [Planctomycetota bacterium]
MKNLPQQTVIVPWDFSDLSRTALKYAVSSVEFHERIEVIHVTPAPTAVGPGIVWGNDTEATIIENLNQSFEEARIKCHLPAIKFTVLFGDPGSRIADAAADAQAGLIIVPSHGRTGISRLLLGSVAERIVRLAPCSVLVYREAVGDA